MTCQQLAEKLKSANHLLESWKMRKESWESRLNSLPTLEVLVANCILAAAFTVYCGPLSASARRRVFDSLVSLCQSCGLPPDSGHSLLSLSSYPAFMLGEVRGNCVNVDNTDFKFLPLLPAFPISPRYRGASPGPLQSAECLHNHSPSCRRVATGGGPPRNGGGVAER